MRLKSLLFLALLLPVFLNAQVKDSVNTLFKTQGTIMMAVKAKDGIIIVTDSRLTYRSTQDNAILAYRDGLPKVFLLKKFAIAVAGDFSDGEALIKKIISNFDNSHPSYRTPEECLYKFGLFTKTKYPAYFKELDSNFLICVGYCPEQSIGILVKNKTYTITPKTWASNVYWEMDSLHLFVPPQGSTSKQLAGMAESAMKEYIKTFHKENEMGGLFSVLKVSPDNSYRWEQNDFSGNDYLTECEAARALFNKKIKLEYTSDNNKKLIHEMNRKIRERCSLLKLH